MKFTTPDSRFSPHSLAAAALLAGVAGAHARIAAPSLSSVGIETAAEPNLQVTAEAERPTVGPMPAPLVEPDRSILPANPAPIDERRMYYDEPGDGNVWVRGKDYKASFGADGAIYYPRFGPRAPRNVPHALSPDLVTCGGKPVAFARAASAVHAGDRVELDRGAFVEAYELSPASMEQTFVFESLPGTGELVLRIPVASELAGRADEAGIEFRGDLGRVTYGRAVAIDAAGRRAAARTELVDGAITIRVDAAFLATATLPMVIDPLITTFPMDVTSTNAYAADVAWSPNFACWLAVYEIEYSASDHDVFARILNIDGSVRHAGFVDVSTTSWVEPRCASLNAYDQCLVVAIRSFGEVVGREVGMLNLSQFAPIVIGSGYTAVVGGDPYPTPGSAAYYCVVFERLTSPTTTGIFMRLVRPNNTFATPETTIVNEPFSVDTRPAISKSNGGTEWGIVWEYRDSLNGHTWVMNARVRWDGAVTVPWYYLAEAPLQVLKPNVSSPLAGTNDYLVAYQRRETGQTQSDIALLMLDNTTIVSTLNLSQAEATGPSRDQIDPCVDTDGSHFLVAYRESSTGSDYDIYATEVGLSGGTLAVVESHVALATSSLQEQRPRIAGLRPAGEVALVNDYVLAWDVGAGTGFGDIGGAVFRGNIGGPKTAYCFGDGTSGPCPCGNASAPGSAAGCLNSFGLAGRLVATGDASTTADTVVLTATGLPPNGTPPTFIQGTAQPFGSTASMFGDGLRCALGTVIRLGTPPSSSGSSSYGYGVPGTQLVSVRGAVLPAGGTRYYQVSYRNSAVFCTADTFNLTNGVRIVWMP